MEFGFQWLFRIMNNLSFNGNIFVFFNLSFLGNIFNFLLWDILGNILSKIFNSIIVSDGYLSRYFFIFDFFSEFLNLNCSGDSFNSRLFNIFSDLLFKGNIFNSALTFDNFLTSVDSSVHNLRTLMSNCTSLMGRDIVVDRLMGSGDGCCIVPSSLIIIGTSTTISMMAAGMVSITICCRASCNTSCGSTNKSSINSRIVIGGSLNHAANRVSSSTINFSGIDWLGVGRLCGLHADIFQL